MSKIITIYDSDAIAYCAAAVVDKRLVEVKHLPSGRTKEFNTRTEFKEVLKNKGMEFVKENYEFTDKLVPGELSKCIKIMKNQIEKINSDLFADEMLMCIQGLTNLRDDLPLPSKYKGSRIGTLRPTWLREAKTYLYKNYPSIVAKNRECDDDVIIQGYKYLGKGYTPILISVDKDSAAYSGLSLYDYTQDNPEVRLVPDFGSLWQTDKEVKGEGFIWFCFQFLNGDPSDDYKPCELANVRFGKQAAYKILSTCKTHQEALQAVIDQYRVWYPSEFTYTAWDGSMHIADYRRMLQLYFCCARMMTTEDDMLNLDKFLNNYGIKL
jgi:hypothetical protein